ncbi:hypothetical protein [Streptomyces tremellae]|uniref:Lipoprotein n=1 Tax=Streptomyces tremellae TaxID=1124239 RepID=A0ABP7EGL9_9ACTN
MALDITGLTDAVVSHAMACGRFETVNGHEPMAPPASGGLTAGVWVDQVRPVRSSGLASVSAGVTFLVRVYTSAMSEPLDAIDPALIEAVDDLCTAYAGDFTLGGLVRNVDLFGQANGTGLDVRAGFLRENGVTLRVMTITLPLIVNDLWEEEA